MTLVLGSPVKVPPLPSAKDRGAFNADKQSGQEAEYHRARQTRTGMEKAEEEEEEEEEEREREREDWRSKHLLERSHEMTGFCVGRFTVRAVADVRSRGGQDLGLPRVPRRANGRRHIPALVVAYLPGGPQGKAQS